MVDIEFVGQAPTADEDGGVSEEESERVVRSDDGVGSDFGPGVLGWGINLGFELRGVFCEDSGLGLAADDHGLAVG